MFTHTSVCPFFTRSIYMRLQLSPRKPLKKDSCVKVYSRHQCTTVYSVHQQLLTCITSLFSF